MKQIRNIAVPNKCPKQTTQINPSTWLIRCWQYDSRTITLHISVIEESYSIAVNDIQTTFISKWNHEIKLVRRLILMKKNENPSRLSRTRNMGINLASDLPTKEAIDSLSEIWAHAWICQRFGKFKCLPILAISK